MKNLLNQDLVCGGTSGEWIIPSGEWVLGSGEWALVPAKLRWRWHARKLVQKLARADFALAASRGAVMGLVLILVETLLTLPAVFRIHLMPPLQDLVAAVVFDLLFGTVLGLLATPCLMLRRGRLLHFLAMVGMLFAVHLAAPARLELSGMIAHSGPVAVISLFGLFLFVARWRALRWTTAVLGTAAIATAMAIPHLISPVKWDLPERLAVAGDDAPNVLLIVLDTLRSDRLDLMGYERPTFPWLNEFAAEGAVFERALSAAPWTLPSHASMFTGLYPSAHGAHHESTYLREDRTTLAEVFYQQGWDTLAVSSNPWITPASGVAQGFAVQKPVWMGVMGPNVFLAHRIAWNLGLVETDLNGKATLASWLDWLDEWEGERPFFAFLNYVEPHIPYHELPRGYVGAFSPPGTSYGELRRASQAVMDAEAAGRHPAPEDAMRASELYDAGIRYEADLVKQTITALRKRGVLDETIVVLVSDHGDQLGEHGGLYNHTRSLVEPLLSVPLVVRYPRRVPAGWRIGTPVSTAALMPTILDLAGLEPSSGLQTRSFAPLFDGASEESVRSPLLAESYGDKGECVTKDFQPRHLFDRLGVRYRALEEGGWKLVVDSTGNRWLFRPTEDPSESRNLAADHPDVVEQLAKSLDGLVRAYGLGELDRENPAEEEAPEMDPEVRQRLEALGYLG